MTTIQARRSSGGFRCAIRASGHATGSEKACAAVLDFWADEEAKGAFEMAVIGLAQVAKAEPERVSVRICED